MNFIVFIDCTVSENKNCASDIAEHYAPFRNVKALNKSNSTIAIDRDMMLNKTKSYDINAIKTI